MTVASDTRTRRQMCVRGLVLTALLAVCTVVPGGSSASYAGVAQADAPARATSAYSRVFISAQPKLVRKGGYVKLFAWTNAQRPGRRLVIWEKLTAPGRSWRVEAVRYTDSEGYVVYSEDINAGDRWYQACWRDRCSRTLLVRMKR